MNIPNSVTSIGSYAFHHTAWFDDCSEGMIYLGKIAYYYKGKMPEDTNFEIQNGTIGIAGLAFEVQSNLKSINIPASLVDICGNFRTA